MKIVKFTLLLASLFFAIISVNAQATNYADSGCSWVITSTQPVASFENAKSYACYNGTTLYATAVYGTVSYAGPTCKITPISGYIAIFGNYPVCTSAKIVRPLPECPVQTNGCTTSRDMGKWDLDANWLFPETYYFDNVFNSSCNTHDTCYGTVGMSKSTCDSNFLSNMRSACDNKYDYKWYDPRYPSAPALKSQCKTYAEAYYGVVSINAVALGEYNLAQQTTINCLNQ